MVRGGEGGLASTMVPAGGAAVGGGRWLTRAGNQLKCSQLLQIIQNIFIHLQQGFTLIHNTVLILLIRRLCCNIMGFYHSTIEVKF